MIRIEKKVLGKINNQTASVIENLLTRQQYIGRLLWKKYQVEIIG